MAQGGLVGGREEEITLERITKLLGSRLISIAQPLSKWRLLRYIITLLAISLWSLCTSM